MESNCSPTLCGAEMITDVIHKLVDRLDLNEIEARHAMEELMAGRATDAQVAGFLMALRMKGETALELASFARVMRNSAFSSRAPLSKARSIRSPTRI